LLGKINSSALSLNFFLIVTRTQKQFLKNFQCDFSKNMNGIKSIFSKIKFLLKPLQFEEHIEKIRIQLPTATY
jgi:hypothetical protein